VCVAAAAAAALSYIVYFPVSCMMACFHVIGLLYTHYTIPQHAHVVELVEISNVFAK